MQHLLDWGFGLLAEAHLHDHQPVEALRLLDDALSRVERTGERLSEPELHRLRALALFALPEPRPEQARGSLQRAVTIAGEQGSALLRQRAIDTGRTVAPAVTTAAGASPTRAPGSGPGRRTPPAPVAQRVRDPGRAER